MCWFVLKRIGHYFSNKYYAVVEQVVDKEELMDCTRDDPVIYVCSSNGFEIVSKEKIDGKK